ncbi:MULTISPECIES: hypothetical protein [Actinosynnema]|uniref:hypothetical protein n=1 Tax=Actinosynnema TaxID=40566 RepID=UPI0020A431C1|nr:hypothetical protein [Actinosynnema pretiosum]MCP2097147.1 hypothetical protein [Actinosynnema pretiosum]
MNPEDVLGGLRPVLSLRRRVGYLLVGLGGLVGACLIGVLWATEAALPVRTAASFAVLMVIGVGWAGFALWVLTRRAPLYARDRVVAAWLGGAAWAVFSVGALVIVRGAAGGWLLGVIGGLGVVAVVNGWFAGRERARLLRRVRELRG